MYAPAAARKTGRYVSRIVPSFARLASLRIVLACGVLLVPGITLAAEGQGPHGPRVLPPGPMLDGGHLALSTPELKIDLLRYSGTVASLSPASQPTLDYTPGDLLKERSANTFYHLGDLDVRYRAVGAAGWTDVSTAFARKPVEVLSADGTQFRGDVTSSLPSGTPLKAVRTWTTEGGTLTLRFTLTNTSGAAVEIGGLGIPMVFNNIMNGRTLDQAYKLCSFYDPYIGEDAGYVQVSQLSGTGPVLLVVPDGHTPFWIIAIVRPGKGCWTTIQRRAALRLRDRSTGWCIRRGMRTRSGRACRSGIRRRP
jgi:hypothetical protein